MLMSVLHAQVIELMINHYRGDRSSCFVADVARGRIRDAVRVVDAVLVAVAA